MYEVILFQKEDFKGIHQHVFAEEFGNPCQKYFLGNPNLKRSTVKETNMNDIISSVIIISGIWNFYKNVLYDEDNDYITLTPGIYRSVDDIGKDKNIKNNTISSVRLAPEDKWDKDSIGNIVAPDPLTAYEIILFKHKNFQGYHHHIFSNTFGVGIKYLKGTKMNNEASSVVVKSGKWFLYRDAKYQGVSSNLLTPGRYMNIEDNCNIVNDTVSSVALATEDKWDHEEDGSIKDPDPLTVDEIILFYDINFQGDHYHIFGEESGNDYLTGGPSLSVDTVLEIGTSSVIIKSGKWSFYRKKFYADIFGGEGYALEPGMYPIIENHEILDKNVFSVERVQKSSN